MPGALHIPRGMLELQVEGRVPDKDRKIVVYCAGGTRSALAAQALGQLGYSDVASMAGGFNKWKDEGREWVVPRTLDADQRNRYQRHLLLPEVGEAGQQKPPGVEGAPPRRRRPRARRRRSISPPPVSGRSVSSTWTSSTPPTCSARSCTTSTASGNARSTRAKKTITAMNPDVDVVTYDVRLGAGNVLDIIDSYEVIVDGTDNFPTRYLVNDASLLKRIPVVHGSIFRFEGQATVFYPYEGPCYRCLVPEPPPAELAPSCAEAGVLGVLPGIIGSIQAVETIKLLLGIGDPLVGRLLAYDALEQSFRTFKIRRDPQCPACGENAGEIVIAEYDELCMPHPKQAAGQAGPSVPRARELIAN